MRKYVIRCSDGINIWFVGKGITKYRNGSKTFNTVEVHMNAKKFLTPTNAEKYMQKLNSTCDNFCWDYQVIPCDG